VRCTFTFTLYTENALECFYIPVVTLNRICNMPVGLEHSVGSQFTLVRRRQRE